MNTSDLINLVNKDKSKNQPIFAKGLGDRVFDKVTNKQFRRNENLNPQHTPSPKSQSIADQVINADLTVKKSVEDLILKLAELGDKEIALKLIGEHILMLNEMFKDFEKL